MTTPLSHIIATAPYSPEQLALTARANKIVHVMFVARRKGQILTKKEAMAIVDGGDS